MGQWVDLQGWSSSSARGLCSDRSRMRLEAGPFQAAVVVAGACPSPNIWGNALWGNVCLCLGVSFLRRPHHYRTRMTCATRSVCMC